MQPTVEDPNPNNEDTSDSPQKKQKLPTSATTIPKLIGIVEIIKREYGKWTLARQGSDGRPVEDCLRMGLHQYNELSTLESLGFAPEADGVDEGAPSLRNVLQGKNFLRQKFSPHLKVTLSVSALPDLEKNGATYQPPPPLQKSKQAKARERKRKRKEAEDDGQ